MLSMLVCYVSRGRWLHNTSNALRHVWAPATFLLARALSVCVAAAACSCKFWRLSMGPPSAGCSPSPPPSLSFSGSVFGLGKELRGVSGKAVCTGLRLYRWLWSGNSTMLPHISCQFFQICSCPSRIRTLKAVSLAHLWHSSSDPSSQIYFP